MLCFVINMSFNSSSSSSSSSRRSNRRQKLAVFISTHLCGAGTAIAVFAAHSGIANAVLPSAKGHGMGYGWRSFCYGLAFFFPGLIFGHVSSIINPAFCLGLAVAGSLTVKQFFALAGSELLGAFLGGILIWLHWIPHFKPTPGLPSKESLQLPSHTQTRTQLRRSTSSFYNPLSIRGIWSDLRYYIWHQSNYVAPSAADDQLSLISPRNQHLKYNVTHDHVEDQALTQQVEQMLRRACEESLAKSPEFARLAGSIKINILDDEQQNQHDVQHMVHQAKAQHMVHFPNIRTASTTAVERVTNKLRTASITAVEMVTSKRAAVGKQRPLTPGGWVQPEAPIEPEIVPRKASDTTTIRTLTTTADDDDINPNVWAKGRDIDMNMRMHRGEPERGDSTHVIVGLHDLPDTKDCLEAEYQAALVADQNAKLSIFATRPAIYAPVFNFLVEYLGTLMLVFVNMLIMERAKLQSSTDVGELYAFTVANYYTGVWFVILLLGLGGPTGLAVNPARDLGPRIAYALLPIPNKGPSEWHYSWIPVLAPFAGGATAGVLFTVIERLY